MKIGILTFHCAHNYGAVLQCYALKTILKENGYDIEVIDYRPQYLLNPYKIFKLSRFSSKNPIIFTKNSIKEILTIIKRFRRHNKFEKFIDFYIVPQKSEISNYDVYIMGSDQIWNPRITKGFDPIYFGYFPFCKKNKKYISYAASMEATILTSQQSDFFKSALKNFNSISVRENNLKELLEPLTEKKIHTVLDPTFLLPKSIWDKICIKPNINKKYVLVYQVRENNKLQETAQNIANQLNATVINLCAYPKWKFNLNLIQTASPCEFLGWIKFASCVVTTSFHGTAFSVIFNKPFYCIKLNDKFDSRAESLLKNIGLEDRLISLENNIKYTSINYSKSNNTISNMRDQSITYLKDSINY